MPWSRERTIDVFAVAEKLQLTFAGQWSHMCGVMDELIVYHGDDGRLCRRILLQLPNQGDLGSGFIDCKGDFIDQVTSAIDLESTGLLPIPGDNTDQYRTEQEN